MKDVLKIQFNRWLLALLIVLLLSILFWIYTPRAFERRIYLFPRHYSPGIGAEERLLPKQDHFEQSISLYVREYLLGPSLNKLFRILPLRSRIKSILINENTIFIDLDYQSLNLDPESRISFYEAVELLKQGVLMNFPSIQEVIVTVEGREYEKNKIEPTS
jgi:hypothetical protein